MFWHGLLLLAAALEDPYGKDLDDFDMRHFWHQEYLRQRIVIDIAFRHRNRTNLEQILWNRFLEYTVNNWGMVRSQYRSDRFDRSIDIDRRRSTVLWEFKSIEHPGRSI